MNLAQKFYSDIERIKKHNRDSSGKLNKENVKNQIVALFENNNRGMCQLPQSLAEYWISEYVNPEFDSGRTEISIATIDKIVAMYSFLLGDDDTDCLTKKDWQKIGEAVKFEAEELPMEVLSALMKILVEKQAY